MNTLSTYLQEWWTIFHRRHTNYCLTCDKNIHCPMGLMIYLEMLIEQERNSMPVTKEKLQVTI